MKASKRGMLGVIANPLDDLVVREFFELFKIPWEYCRRGERYEVILCAGDANLTVVTAKLLIVFAGEYTSLDHDRQIQIQSTRQSLVSTYRGSRLPISGSVIFRHRGTDVMVEESSGESVAYIDRFGEQVVVRVGYDLFGEVRNLLSHGQSPANGGTPSLDLHIALIRDLVVGCGIPLIEIPPVPNRHPFIACLTHDVDHPSIRQHKFDATTFGFLYRAVVGSVVDLARGRISLTKLLTNLSAAAKLPFVYLGFARDFWNQFERYLEIEKGRPSTFFVIPFANCAGQTPNGPAPRLRASKYGASHIAAMIRRLISAGGEVGLHGIDAWTNTTKGREEKAEICRVSQLPEIGVRMHWLYMGTDSFELLEEAGFLYDSTIGYNETVGYRAGTSQVFKPLQARGILELPLHIMDTALFYRKRMDLSSSEAWAKIIPILHNSMRDGGVLTINWHDRSIAPERLWGDFYVRLLNWLEDKDPWFATASQAVSWFRWRRSVTFESVVQEPDSIRAKIMVPSDEGLPSLRLRVYQPREVMRPGDTSFHPKYSHRDIPLNGDVEMCIPLERGASNYDDQDLLCSGNPA